MSKGGKSTTETQIPSWLSGALMPLIQGSTGAAGEFMAQGQNILKGLPHSYGATPAPPAGGGVKVRDMRTKTGG